MAGTTLIVNYKTGEYIFPITAFSTTASCGDAIWKYIGLNLEN